MIKLEFKVLCDDCGETLEANIDVYGEKIHVPPCLCCLSYEYRRGYQEGAEAYFVRRTP